MILGRVPGWSIIPRQNNGVDLSSSQQESHATDGTVSVCQGRLTQISSIIGAVGGLPGCCHVKWFTSQYRQSDLSTNVIQLELSQVIAAKRLKISAKITPADS